MARKLQVWNGRGIGVDHKYNGMSAYICAHSRADAVRLLEELGFSSFGMDREIKIYFSPCWGHSMSDITPERGLWICKDYNSEPQRIYSKSDEVK